MTWCELNDIVSIMVDDIDICNVEVTTGEFLMVRDLVQMVGEIRIRALLLKGACAQLTKHLLVVLLVVHLLHSTLVESIISMRIHHIRQEDASAIRVLKVVVFAALTELSSITFLTFALLFDAVESTKSIAHEFIRLLLRDTDNMLFIVAKLHV